jgi:hypothetical protein
MFKELFNPYLCKIPILKSLLWKRELRRSRILAEKYYQDSLYYSNKCPHGNAISVGSTDGHMYCYCNGGRNFVGINPSMGAASREQSRKNALNF